MLHDRQLAGVSRAINTRSRAESGGRSHPLVIVLDLAARAAARTGRFDLAFVAAAIADRTDRGRKEVGDPAPDLLLGGGGGLNLLFLTRTTLGPLAARTIFARLTLLPRLTLFARAIVTRALFARLTVFTRLTILARAVVAIAVTALVAITARLALVAILALGPLLARLIERFLVALAVEALVLAIILIVLRRTLILEARPGLAQHAEIMIRELQIVFSLHTVPGELRIAGHVLVFFEKLRGITAAALIAATTAATASPETSRLLTPTTATAAALAIVHQA